MKLVMKFGGATLGNGEQFRDAARIIRDHASAHKLVVVVSAMSGVTQALTEIAAQSGPIKELRWRHLEAAGKKELLTPLLDELETVLRGVSVLGELTARSRDRIADYGERLAAALLSAALDARAVRHRVLAAGQSGIVTDAQFGAARPLPTLEALRANLEPLMSQGVVPVLTGLTAATGGGVITSFGRGGSDITAALAGAAIGADEVWLWGDNDGLMTADPAVVPQARLIREVTPAEAIEMAQFGARAVHPRALEHGVVIRVRNAFHADVEGTRISPKAESRGAVRAVHAIRDVGILTLSGPMMFGRPGTAALLFDALARQYINVLMISQSVSESGISVALRRDDLERARDAVLRQLPASQIVTDERVAIVALVGGGLRSAASRVFGAVKADVLAIAQGSNELSISFAVREDQADAVVRALHAEFDPT